MKNIILISGACLLLVIGCKEEINNPITNENKYYSVEGNVYSDGMPLKDIEVILNSSSCLSDSNGYFKFDSVKSSQALISLSHPKYIPFDTLLNVSQNISLSFFLSLRSKSFYPCKIGNKWFYKEPNSNYELAIEVIDSIQIDNEIFYKFLYAEFAPHFNDTSKYIYLRQIKADTLYEYSCDEKQLLAPFITTINQAFVFKRCYPYNVSYTYDGKLYEANKDILKYYYSARFTLDGDWDIVFQRGIGMIKYTNPPWTNYILVNYEIKY